MAAVPFLWNEPVEKLEACDGCVIIGGFSYEDRGRAGIIASLDPIMENIGQAAIAGKPVLGICNGAQILAESGLIPGVTGNKVAMALAMNKRVKNRHVLGTGFYNDWIYLKPPQAYPNNAFLRYLVPEKPIYIPTAHGEGRFILADGLMKKLEDENIAILKYCDKQGAVKSEFPINPNGSEHNLAAVCNKAGNVMAIMPHPERTPAGDAIFHSMRAYIEENNYPKYQTIGFDPPVIKILNYKLSENSRELIVSLIIADNAAISMQTALRNLGYKINLSRQIHWEIQYTKNPQQTEKQIIDSCELFNPNKEISIKKEKLPHENTISVLVQDKDNLTGRHKYEALTEKFGIKNIEKITQGTLWHITAQESNNLEKIAQKIIARHILFNPYAHKYYIY